MTKIAEFLEKEGFILRSGAAEGADSAFEEGVNDEKNKEIFLPWEKFNKNGSILFSPPTWSYLLASFYHPNWENLKIQVKRLMARNMCQILGFNGNEKVEFVICFTLDGKDSGGTGQALRVARNLKIPILNLYKENTLRALKNRCKIV